MFIHKPSGVQIKNRKAAIILMGHKRYNKALANKEFDFKHEDTRERNNN